MFSGWACFEAAHVFDWPPPGTIGGIRRPSLASAPTLNPGNAVCVKEAGRGCQRWIYNIYIPLQTIVIYNIYIPGIYFKIIYIYIVKWLNQANDNE